MTDDNTDVLAWLKGPALAIFLAVGRSHGIGPSGLIAATGWGRGATYDALRKLARAGWIEKSRRGCWQLTAAGRAAWGELLGEREPRAGSIGPSTGTVIHNEVPPSATDIHSPTAGVPADGPSSRRKVPANGTPARRKMPGNDTINQKNGPGNGTPSRESVPRNGTRMPIRPTDHDDDCLSDDTDIKIIINTLKAMEPSFDDVEEWLPTVDRTLIMPWYHYVEQHKRNYRNPTGYLRRCVERGHMPPQRRGRPAERAPCPTCGRDFWGPTGSCLVCDGVIKC